MAVRNGASEALPTSHFFVTIARGRAHRTYMARSGLVFVALALLPLVLVWLCGSTLYLALHDDVVTSLMMRQRDMQYDYEDRLAALRSRLDRDTSRQILAQRSIGAKLDELTAREAELQSRSAIVDRLDEQVSRVLGAQNMSASSVVRTPARATEGSPATKPGEVTTGPPGLFGNPHAALDDRTTASWLPERMSALAAGLDTIGVAQESHVVALDRKVQTAMARYRDALNTAGLSLDRLAAAVPSGGPFVPLAREDDATPFGRTSVGLQLSLSEAARVGTAIGRAPFSKPLHGTLDVTSPFGPRVDPFLGRPAMHTGIDFSGENGTDIFATAPGRITSAGQASGYGLMVEIDHGAGLSTRYAHLSAAEVAVGQTVKRGDLIGHVGATGRATGPHLHYETRVDGEAVDPTRFLAAGRRLSGDGDPL